MAKKQLDLSSFKVKDKGLLKQTEKNTNIEKKVDSIIKQIGQGDNLSTSPIAGRPPKPSSEKESKPITLKFTESQYTQIVHAANGVPLATYLKKLLTENKLI